MKKSILITFSVLALVLVGCQGQAPAEQQAEPSPQEQAPTEEVVVVPEGVAENENPIVRKPQQVVVPVPDEPARTGKVGLVNLWGTSGATRDEQRKIINVNKIKCDKSERTLQFTLRNPKALTEGRVWRLDPPVPRDAPSNHVATQVFLNGYQVNSPVYHYYRNGERMFGPNAKFSDNCGGKTQLKGGQTATCSLTNVPLKSQKELNGYNRVFINTPHNQVLFQFMCEE